MPCHKCWTAAGLTILPNVGGWLGAVYTKKAVNTWYKTLRLPDWRPPNEAFPLVWTALYSGMGYASYLVYRDGGGFTGEAHLPLVLYGGQLALNWIWTPIFFGAKSISGGLIDIVLLDAAAVATAFSFFKVNKHAGYLFVPYIAWLGVATALNYTIYRNENAKNKKDDDE